jgi:5-methylcytosine-specific restriction enzyme A
VWREQDKHRPNSTIRGYDAAWRAMRRQVLLDEPLCRECFDRGLVAIAVEVHHIRSVRSRPDLRLSRNNLAPLCRSCHSAHTMRESVGG